MKSDVLVVFLMAVPIKGGGKVFQIGLNSMHLSTVSLADVTYAIQERERERVAPF